MSLDLDDPRPPYQQVAAKLRAAILTGKLAPGERLPTQVELSKTYGVARMTIQQALRILRDDGLIATRQGSGMFVRQRTTRPIALRPHIEQGFKSPQVRIDFSGYTAETLNGILTEPLDQIRNGSLSPESIRLRLLLPDLGASLALPIAVDRDATQSQLARERMAAISDRHVGLIQAAVEELVGLDLVPDAKVAVRLYESAPLFKVYIINDAETFFGYYPVMRHDVTLDRKSVAIYDPMGKDAVMFHYSDDGDPDSTSTQFLTQTRNWFNSIWDSIAQPLP
ncbi:GntR family transcriptional regulator [Mycolicibacterium fallax]|uniref:GntR family transcriptional regulator n=1 Tax=Mycolicibacterium fallax TaxID=1793 RepID=A0A1X1RFL3_MYCFA|nr:GntR family transcriptional regulator [Mycolicibacterium fallax]ORV04565.1 GntR family transcriptional regulator [Mycolicibacterium fallax]BBY99699.1 GntR family transcriptional regulator [Mycolicibacterium fallax]